jgi:hypothetical protein
MSQGSARSTSRGSGVRRQRSEVRGQRSDGAARHMR